MLRYSWLALFAVAASFAQTNPLSFRPVAAEYSSALDRIVMISANPSQLHIYNPASQSDTAVSLSKPPLSLSISPDGLHAAVGHDLLVSYVNLSTNAVEKVFTTTITSPSVVLGTDWVYVFASSTSAIGSIRISTGVETDVSAPRDPGARLHPSGKAIYGVQQYSSFLQKYDVSTGPITTQTTSPPTFHNLCGNIWFSPDGARIYTGCSTILRYSSDAAADMLYFSTLTGLTAIAHLTDSAAAKKVAAIPGATSSYGSTVDDGDVYLFDSSTLKPVGQLTLPQFTVSGKSYAAHGRWVFFDNAGANVSVIMQADGTSGLLQDFAIQRYPIAAPTPCSVTVDKTTATAISTGSYATIAVTAAADCIYQASTTDTWIQLVSGFYGSGTNTLTYITRPNPTTASRAGTITINGQAIAISQSAAPATTPTYNRIPYKIVDAEYDKPLDRIVFVSANPDELHIYDPVAATDQFVALSAPPLALSVGPDGTHAAVGHDGSISYVNLNTVTVERVFQVQSTVTDVVLGGNGWIYAFPAVLSLQVSTATVTALSNNYGSTSPARLHPSGNYIYTASPGKWDITQGAAKSVQITNYASTCSNLWITEDGLRLVTACGTVYRSSDVPQFDFQNNGSLAAAQSVRWAAHSAAQQSIAVLPGNSQYSQSTDGADSEVQIYGDASLGLAGRLSLPKFPGTDGSVTSHGRFVFWNAAGSKLFVVTQADSAAKLASDFAIGSISPADVTGCTYSVTPSAPSISGSGGNLSFKVTTGASCVWTAIPDVSWIARSQSFTGSGTVTINIQASNTIVPRTGTFSIGNQVVTITQAGVVGSVQFNSGSTLQIPATGANNNSLYVTANAADYSWTATSNVAWITLTNSSGTGSGTVQYAVEANSGGSSRMGVISVGDQHVAIIQAGANGYGSVTVTPSSISAPAAGSSGALAVTGSPSDFTWVAFSNNPWIVISGGAPTTGNGQVTYQVQASAIPNSRQGTILIGNQVVTVTQAGNGTVTLNPSSASFTGVGGTGTLTITASSSDFNWTITPQYNGWVNWGYSSSGTGNGQLTYTVQQNFSTSPRTASFTIANQTFTITQAGATPGLRFVPVTPCRVLDTRLATGPFGGPTMTGGSQRDFAIPQGPCGVPINAQAYSVNVTVVPKRALGFLTAWPTGQTKPFVSTLNSLDGRIVANAALIPAGTNGSISLYVTDDADVVLDINGYFAPANTANALQFFPVIPCRVADTRLTAGSFGGPTLDAGASRSFPVPSSTCNVPASAAAYSLNVTAVPNGSLGYLTTWPTGQTQPFVSTLNSLNGAIVANAAIVPAGTSGAISVYVTNKSDVVIDINGYFAPPGSGGMQFYSLTPCRVMDTRNATNPLGGPSLAGGIMRTVPVTTSTCAAPPNAQAFSMNATVVPPAPLSYLTMWPAGQTQPLVSTLNSLNGAIVANAAIVPAGTSGGVNVFATDATDLVLDINGYFAP